MRGRGRRSWPSLVCDFQPPCFKDLGMASASYHPPGTARMKLPPPSAPTNATAMELHHWWSALQ